MTSVTFEVPDDGLRVLIRGEYIGRLVHHTHVNSPDGDLVQFQVDGAPFDFWATQLEEVVQRMRIIEAGLKKAKKEEAKT